ncbi:insulinase family protein [Aliidiomarina sp. Khilg15.8]
MPGPAASICSAEEIEKSPYDHRSYQYVKLHNGLRVLLVHDEDALHSAAAVGVNAGHFQDPLEAQGLAHFLEHMLFMGSETYPNPSDYPDFVSEHGGQHNAWTGTEHTNFYFDVQPSYFNDALARFSQLFIAPRFAPEWIEKELNAVESEYRMKLTDELRRLYQVHKETANPKHPFTKFSVGNAQTLAGSSKRSIKQHLHDFFDAWYRAQHLSLVLVGPQSLDELEALAKEHFSDVAGEGKALPPITEPLYSPSQQGVCIHIRPLKQACRLILTLPLPGINQDYAHKTTSLLAHLLGYEGPGSLLAELRERGWATSLSAGGGVSGSNFKDFNFNVQLTELGLEHYLEVVRIIFTAIDEVRWHGVTPLYYAERAQMVGLAYRYQEAIPSVELASQLSINMLHYAPEHVISGDYLMQGLNREMARLLLEHMVPERARIMLIHQSLPVNQTTELYETAYRITPISADDLNRLRQPVTDCSMHLPAANRFIPTRSEALPLAEPVRRLPAMIPSTPALQAWHLQDPDFRVPKGHLYLSLILPDATKSHAAFVRTRLWCELVLDKLNERCYDAEVAGISFNLYPQQSGISVHISGFSERQPDLLAKVLQALTDFEFAETQFNAIQHNLYHNWMAVNRHKPINHLFTILNQQLQRGCYVAQDLAAELPSLSAEQFSQEMPAIFASMNARMLIHGDWPASVARKLTTLVSDELGLKNRPQQAPLREVRLLQAGRRVHCSTQLPHPDSAVALFCQGQSLAVEEKSAFLLLNYLVSPGFFSELRTEQQLGYMVGTSYVPMNGRPGLLFYVQSPHADLETMQFAIDDFLQAFCEQLHTLKEAQWQGAKRSVIAQLTDADPNLRIRAQRMWTSISIDDTHFDLADKLAASVASMSLDRLVELAQDRLVSEAAAMLLTCEPIPAAASDDTELD